MREPHTFSVLLDRVDPARNMARYYRVAVEPTLFGWSTVVRDWGRIGRTARRRLDLYENVGQAVVAADRLLQRKLRRGYVHDDGVDHIGEMEGRPVDPAGLPTMMTIEPPRRGTPR